MTSKTLILSPSEKPIHYNRDSSTSFTDDVTLSKITLRTKKNNKKLKRNNLAKIGEDTATGSQIDSLSYQNEVSTSHKKTSLNSDNAVKNSCNDLETDEIFGKSHSTNPEIETQVENYDFNINEKQLMFETSNSSSCRKLKKHKKKKKLDNPESSFEPANVYIEEKRRKKLKRHRFTEAGEEGGNQTDSFSLPNEESILHKKPRLNSNNVTKNSYETENDDLNENKDHMLCETTNENFCGQLKKHKKKKKHKYSEKYCDDPTNYILVPSIYSGDTQEKTKQLNSNNTNLNPRLSIENQDTTEMLSGLATLKTKKRNTSTFSHPSSPDLNQSSDSMCPENEIQNSQGEMSSISVGSNKKQKNKRVRFSLLNDSQLSTMLNKNNYCVLTEPNKSKKSKKHEFTISPTEVCDESSPVRDELSNNLSNKHEINLNISKTKQKTYKNDDVFCNQKLTVDKKNQVKNFNKAVNVPNNEMKSIEENQEDLIPVPHIKVNSKSDRSNKLNMSIDAKDSKINTKTNNNISEVKFNSETIQKVKKTKTKSNVRIKNSSCDITTENPFDNSPNKPDSVTVFADEIKDIKHKQHISHKSKDESFDKDKIQQALLAAALESINKSPKVKKIKKSKEKVKDNSHKESNRNKKRKKKISNTDQGQKGSYIAMELEIAKNMSPQAEPQASTSQDVGSFDKVKSEMKPKKLLLLKANKTSSKFKTVKHKHGLDQDAKFDIEKIQKKLIAAALKKVKKVNSVSTESKTSENPEESHPGKIEPALKKIKGKKSENPARSYIEHTKRKNCKTTENSNKNEEEVKRKNNVISKKKLKAKTIIDPLEDFTAKLLLAELKKRKEN